MRSYDNQGYQLLLTLLANQKLFSMILNALLCIITVDAQL